MEVTVTPGLAPARPLTPTAARVEALRRAAIAYASRLGWRIYRQHGLDRDGRCTCGDHCAPRDRGKHPAGRGWRDAASTDGAALASWWALVPFNLGHLLGPDVAAIDLDDVRDLGALDRFGPWPITPTVRSGRGLHLYFRAPLDGGCWPTLRRVDDLAVETKGRGASLTLPPSMHPSGALYRWLPGRHPLHIPMADIPPRFLLHVRRIAERQARSAARRHSHGGEMPMDRLLALAMERYGRASNGHHLARRFVLARAAAGQVPHAVLEAALLRLAAAFGGVS